MKFNLNLRDVDKDPDIEDYVNKRLSFALARAEHVINDIHVTIADINGPKGGLDKQCRILLTSDLVEPVVVSERQSTLRAAIDRGVSRASHSLMRRLKRRRDVRHVDRHKMDLRELPSDNLSNSSTV